MTTGQKWGLAIVAVLITLGIIFRKKIARFLIKGSSVLTGIQWTTCENFFVKLSELGDKKIQALHVWETDKKYYKQEIVAAVSGIESEKELVEITEQEFDGFCKDKYLFSEEYVWFHEEARIGNSEGNNGR